ncbi:uncharacterized protein [Asterias amurensis]|uniref:uncharacterized protein isoform X1 n=1 Tax=Asterias amurensis TaxID=7602 RepID=UPI003AB77AD6
MDANENAASLLVFHRDRLNKLRDGISRVLNAFSEVLVASGPIVAAEPAELNRKLQEIEQASWSRIREHFLDSHVPSDGLETSRNVASILLDFTNKLDDVKEALEDRLRVMQKQQDDKKKQDIKSLQKKLADEKENASNLKWRHQELSETSSSEKHLKTILHQQLKEKQDIIAQLKRNGTVQLWEKEKTKLLEGSKQREENLTRELKELRETHEDMKERLQRRIKDLEGKVKLERMRDVVNKITPMSDAEAESESLKRQLYSKDVDLSRFEQEVVNQQRLTVGCIKGIQRDFRVMETRQEGRKLRKDDLRKMNAILDAILQGAREGRLDILKADLPLHYIALPEDIIAHPGKRMTKPSVLAPVVNRHLELIGDSPQASPASSPPGSPKMSPRRMPPLELSHSVSSPSIRSSSSTPVPSIDIPPEPVSVWKPTSVKNKISVDEVSFVTKSPRSLGPKAPPNPNTNPSGRSPSLGQKSRGPTHAPEAPRSPSLLKRRTLSSPVPPNLAALNPPERRRAGTVTGVAGSPSPVSRNGMASARKLRGSSKSQAGNGVELRKEEGTGNGKKPRPRSVVSNPGEVALDSGSQRRKNGCVLTEGHLSVLPEHPDLIDAETGLVDVVTARVCFPHFSEEQIREHLQQFKKYDTNADYSLDFMEMTQAIQSTVSDYYKPRQIKEAMVEIDVDQSDSVDFYEYLGISTMLMMKVGKSEIFRSSMVKHAGGSISKVCSIQ